MNTFNIFCRGKESKTKIRNEINEDPGRKKVRERTTSTTHPGHKNIVDILHPIFGTHSPDGVRKDCRRATIIGPGLVQPKSMKILERDADNFVMSIGLSLFRPIVAIKISTTTAT